MYIRIVPTRKQIFQQRITVKNYRKECKQTNVYFVLYRAGLSNLKVHTLQALNGNKCNAFFVSGKIKEKKKKRYNIQRTHVLKDIYVHGMKSSLYKETIKKENYDISPTMFPSL